MVITSWNLEVLCFTRNYWYLGYIIVHRTFVFRKLFLLNLKFGLNENEVIVFRYPESGFSKRFLLNACKHHLDMTTVMGKKRAISTKLSFSHIIIKCMIYYDENIRRAHKFFTKNMARGYDPCARTQNLT